MQGDPSAVPYAVKNVQEVLGQKPVFGICMGHQILGQAVGGSTFKLKFGHHGGNHPIRFNESGVLPRALPSLGIRRSLVIPPVMSPSMPPVTISSVMPPLVRPARPRVICPVMPL